MVSPINALIRQWSDNFGRQIANPLVDLIDVSGDKAFTAERLRYYKDNARVFLQYGTDPTYSETSQGHKLTPGADQSLELRTAEKAAYQVGFDLWPTMSHRVLGTLETGDVIGGGYGLLDIGNFDPSQVTPDADNPASGCYSGTDADGYFWYYTTHTGVNSILIALVQSGTVLNSAIVDREKAGDVFTIIEQRLNWYAVGPCEFRETYTDLSQDAQKPQVNTNIGAIANDDGKGPSTGSHRVTAGIHQGAGNSGLEFEVGSMGMRAPGTPEPQFKSKGHSMDLDASNPTETYQVAGALRIDPDRENVKLRITGMQIIKTPGSSITRTRVLMMVTDPANTNAPGSGAWETPVEHSPSNSVLEEVSVDQDAATPLTGPDIEAAGTDSTGADTANSVNDPGGYQVFRDSITVDKKSTQQNPSPSNREIYPGDIVLIWVDVESAGTVEVDIQTEQNS